MCVSDCFPGATSEHRCIACALVPSCPITMLQIKTVVYWGTGDSAAIDVREQTCCHALLWMHCAP